MTLSNLLTIRAAQPVNNEKISKTDAVYVFCPESQYKCVQCWMFIPDQSRCAPLGLSDVVRPNGTCTQWAFGSPRPGLTPLGCFTKEQVGYTENPKGTQCRNCINFSAPYCKKVEGTVDPYGCCNLQTPKP